MGVKAKVEGREWKRQNEPRPMAGIFWPLLRVNVEGGIVNGLKVDSLLVLNLEEADLKVVERKGRRGSGRRRQDEIL